MTSLLQQVVRFLCTRYPFRVGHSRLLTLVDRFPFVDDEYLLFVKRLGHSMFVDLRTYMGRHLYYCGTYDPLLADILEAHLKPGMAFFDIGANVGFYSLIAARSLQNTGRVVAFEPQSQCCRLLEKSLRHNQIDNVDVMRLALSDQNGEAVLHQLSSINNGEASLNGVGVQTFGAETVRCATLDSLLAEKAVPPCDIMKVDVEGAEYRVLTGAKEFFLASPPKLVLFEGIDSHLKRFGSSLREVVDFFQQRHYRILYASRGQWHPYISFESYEQAGSPFNFAAILDE